MPVQTTTSPLLAKLGSRLAQAHEEHKHDEPQMGNPSLPAGIEGGIAELREVKIGVYQQGDFKGQPFYMAVGIVKLPHEVKGTPVAGLRTQVGPEPLCDTPDRTGEKARKTFSDHWGWMLNQIRILGIDTSLLGHPLTPKDPGYVAKVEKDLITQLEALRQLKPHFRFRTWSGGEQELAEKQGKLYVVNERGRTLGGPYASEEAAKKDYPYVGRKALVNHEWNGLCEYIQQEGQGVEDHNEEDHKNGQRSTTSPSKATSKAKKKETLPPAPEPEPEPQEEFNEEVDLESLLERAHSMDQEAQIALKKMALDAGNTEEFIDAAESWEEVVNMIRSAKEDKEESAPEKDEEEQLTWAATEVCSYTPEGAKKAVRCKVLTSDPVTKTATLLNLETNKKVIDKKSKAVINIGWDKLSVE